MFSSVSKTQFLIYKNVYVRVCIFLISAKYSNVFLLEIQYSI